MFYLTLTYSTPSESNGAFTESDNNQVKQIMVAVPILSHKQNKDYGSYWRWKCYTCIRFTAAYQETQRLYFQKYDFLQLLP